MSSERISSNQGVFIGKETEVGEFKYMLNRIRQNPMAGNLLEWYGPPGIGKSFLISRLIQECENSNVPFATISFKGSKGSDEDYLKDPTILFENLLDGLSKTPDVDTTKVREQIIKFRQGSLPEEGIVVAYRKMDQETRLYKRPQWLNEMREVAIEFLKVVKTAGNQNPIQENRPIVLLFDETDTASVPLIDFIEEWIVNPTIQIKQAAVIWTDRRPWRWKRPEIRRKLTTEQLQPFSDIEIKMKIMDQDIPVKVAEAVEEVAGRHPEALEVAITEAKRLTEKGELESQYTNRAKLITRLSQVVFSEVIEKHALIKIQSPEMKIAIKHMALVRWVGSKMLAEVLKDSTKTEFKQWDQHDFEQLLLRLQTTQMFVWNMDRGGYTVDKSLRHIIQHYYESNKPEMCFTINNSALKIYNQFMQLPINNRSTFIIEELYHSAKLSKSDRQINLRDVLTKRLNSYPIGTDETDLIKDLDKLEHNLENDEELCTLVGSTKELAILVREFIDRIIK